ncbi:hypothetical protein ACFQLX_03570 [Streptomyces polyrhachis]|uniref:Uncharacterized protein n=1 Tax=Streptomyces polyrhachis TaxID=1282885 RepID=A0ABW2G8Y6_9ACTN
MTSVQNLLGSLFALALAAAVGAPAIAGAIRELRIDRQLRAAARN